MSILISMIPLLVVIILSVWLRYPAYIAALFGVLLVTVLMFSLPELNANVSLPRLQQAFSSASLISLQVALVMITGLYLNIFMEKANVHEALVAWIGNIPMSSEHKQLLIVMGLAPALEAMTGFGVSLLVTVPLLLAITERKNALRQSLLSMNIIPWGTLAIATVIGAQLSGEPVAKLGWQTSLVSIGIFPLFAVIVGLSGCTATLNKRLVIRDGLLVGGILSLGLLFMNRLGITEMAGIFAGLVSATGCWLLFGRKTDIGIKTPWKSLRAYTLLLALVAVMRLLQLLGVPLDAWILTTGTVRFAPLTSPALPLLIVSLVLGRGSIHIGLLKESILRAARPILTLSGFLLMAQLMVVSGMLKTVQNSLPTGKSLALALFSPILGSISGYLTGSNVGGNSLMMTIQSSFGNSIFSAIQNSSAGYAIFASMPMILLVLAIAGYKDKNEESELQRFTLKVLFFVVLLLIFTSFMLLLFL